MNFIKRYKARRAKRKEIKRLRKMVVSVRIEKGAEYSERKFATLCLIEGGLLRAINDIERELCR